MVEWKGEIKRENSGEKAARLDQIQDLEVPNFFTITKEEVKQLIRGQKEPEKIKNKEIPQKLQKEIEKAYKEVGMSSEVRKSGGRARNLVGGQRNNQKVSIRVSNSKKGSTDYKLNVGKSSLEKAIKEVVASFYEENQEDNYPAIIVQKMIEPEKTGALVNNFDRDYQLLESVEGLGITLEEGTTTPDFYLLKNQQLKEKKIAKTQLKTTRHPLNGNNRNKQVDKRKEPYNKNEISKIARKAASQNISLKFAYKRGTFYITDAFHNSQSKIYREQEPTLDLLKASEGEITGTIGRQIKTAEKPIPPEQYHKILFARKGAYTSKYSQIARRKGKTIIISYEEDLTKGKEINEQETEEKQESAAYTEKRAHEVITATEIMPIDQGSPAINTQPPFTQGYSITSLQDTKGKTVDRDNYLTTFQEVFKHGRKDRKQIAIVDARKMENEGLIEAIKYVSADEKLLLLDKPYRDVIATAIDQQYDVIGAEPSVLSEIEIEVARQERKIILNKSLDRD